MAEANPLEIEHLTVEFNTAQGRGLAVNDVTLSLGAGEILVLAGESGCGKSVLCKSILKLLPREAAIAGGSVRVQGEDITGQSEHDMQRLRGSCLGMAFQNPLTILNPSMTMGAQLREAICLQQHMSREEADRQALELLQQVGIADGAGRLALLPQAFSGGQRQRCALAIALARKPKILIADEPTTALDVTVQREILALLSRLRKEMGLSILLVTHDLGVAANIADRVGIMYAGRLIEIGTATEIFHEPRHPYTWGLLSSMPVLAAKGKRISCIAGQPPDIFRPLPGDAFAPRNPYAMDIDFRAAPPLLPISPTHSAATWLLDERAPNVKPPFDFSRKDWYDTTAASQGAAVPDKPPLLKAEHLSKTFPWAGGGELQAVEDVSFALGESECLGLVGESGSGKSTLARLIMGIHAPSAGTVAFAGQDITANRPIAVRRQMQMIFQDADGALDPRMTAGQSIEEGLLLSGKTSAASQRKKMLYDLLAAVELSARCADAYPAELSGGQRQRVAIARCLGMQPSLIVADEPIASLDVSVQAQIINLLCQLQEEQHFAMLFIAHDLAVVHYLCDRIAVMHHGRMVEQGPVEQIFAAPRQPYTRKLLSSALYPDPDLYQ